MSLDHNYSTSYLIMSPDLKRLRQRCMRDRVAVIYASNYVKITVIWIKVRKGSTKIASDEASTTIKRAPQQR